MASEATDRIIAAIRSIPRGRVCSYGLIARLVGMPNGARQVVRALHSSSAKEDLPWFRLLRKDGSIALPTGAGLELQTALLEAEGVEVAPGGKVDLLRFGWEGKVGSPGRDQAERRGAIRGGPESGPHRSGGRRAKAAPKNPGAGGRNRG